MILRGERDYLRQFEPAAEAGWTKAIDKNLQMWVANLHRAQVLVLNGEPVGYSIWLDHEGSALLATVYVSQAYRGQGLGSQLIQGYIDAAASAEFAVLRLGVLETNPAQRLYEKAGFTFTEMDGSYRMYVRELTGVSA